MKQRALRASGIVLILLALTVGIPWISGGGEQAVATPQMQSPSKWADFQIAWDLLTGNDGTAYMALGVRSVLASDAEVGRFSKEAFDIRGFGGLLAGADGRTLGFTSAGQASDLLDRMGVQLRLKGWEGSVNDWGTAGLFTREGGEITWLCILCYQIGEEVSVVLQYR